MPFRLFIEETQNTFALLVVVILRFEPFRRQLIDKASGKLVLLFRGSKMVAAQAESASEEAQVVVNFAGAPGGIRTPNPQIRSLMLCPVELRAR